MANLHEICVRLRKRVRFKIRKISLRQIPYHKINDDAQTSFKTKIRASILNPGAYQIDAQN